MQILIGLIAAAGAVTASSNSVPSISADVAALKPHGKWEVDYGDTGCVATRGFGDPKSPVLLGIRPSLNDSTVRLIVIQDDGFLMTRHVPVTVAGIKASGLRFSTEGSKRRVMRIDLARADFGRATAAASLRIVGEGTNLDLTLTGIVPVVKALETCNADLRTHWNADETGMARITTQAKPLIPLTRFITSEDYPSQAMSEIKGGTTRVMLLIDEQGLAKDCVVEEHSGVASIDAQTCFMVLKRGKFAPASDAAGKPIKSFLSYAFKWKLE